MSVDTMTSPAPGALRVTDDLNRESLPQTHRDPIRKVVWMNAVCSSVLAVGLVLTKKPAEYAFHPELIESAPVIIPQFVPDPTPPKEVVEQDMQDTTEPDAVAPVAPTVVVADPSKVAYAVPVSGPVVTTTDYRYVPPPPRTTSRPKPPAGPLLFRGGPSSDGGYYPKVEYPRDALLRHESGEVRLYAVVNEDGSLEKLEVNVPSGSATLDRSALQGVKKFWRWPAGGRREYIIPIEFRLQ
jgi:TonB family protein